MTPDEFRAALKALGMTHREFARRIKVHHNTVSAWSQGHRPIRELVRLEVVRLLAEAPR